MIPEVYAGWFSVLTFSWINELLSVGYQRPLQVSDLYRLQDERSSAHIAEKILNSFETRLLTANEYNNRLDRGEIHPGCLRIVWWSLRGGRVKREETWRRVDGRKKASLALSMNDSVKWWFWSGGILRFIGDTAQVLTPLVLKAIIDFASKSYNAHHGGGDTSTPPSIGVGIGLAFALLGMQTLASLCTHHYFYRCASTGVLLRGGLITAIYSRSLRLTSGARSTLSNGKLMNHISTDISRIDYCCGFFHLVWAAPLQMIICLIILLVNLGPSALAGFGFFLLATPLQTLVMKKMFRLRQKSMQWTDKRAKLLQELLGGMKVIKAFTWEIPFLARIFEYRKTEMSYIRSLLLLRSANNAFANSLPILASVFAFITYSLSGHELDPATIFSSLTLFMLLKLPLTFLPTTFSSISDAVNALDRLYAVFEAETLDENRVVDLGMDNALEVEDATFAWDSPPPQTEEPAKRKKHLRRRKPIPSSLLEKDSNETMVYTKAFEVNGISLSIPRGQLVAIVGPVGAGKTSLLQGIVGEMRRTSGSVKFGGSVAYCSQSAWIQNATIRENICFGRPFEEERYWAAIRDSCLQRDLEIFPHGDLTEVGEKGIALSGGQKQRINICRAIYSNTSLQIFDDPLSALDAHVGEAVFNNVLKQASPDKTRVLVTHAIHFLPQVDYIYTIVNGRIAERGTYLELMAEKGEFSKFVTEFGAEEVTQESEPPEDGTQAEGSEQRKNDNPSAGMMQEEERNTGAISGQMYGEYLRAGRAAIMVPLLLLSFLLIQGATILTPYWLVYWQERKWSLSSGCYMSVYAGLGVAQAFALFIMGSTFAVFTYFASQQLHKTAMERVMYAPMSFFDTTPLGRIMNRFSKDIDTIDNVLGDSLRMFTETVALILGAIILVSVLLPWFLIAVGCTTVAYFYTARYYRASARELKRLDAILRSSLYSHFSESLSGLATIRAYGESERFRQENEGLMDGENCAYWLTAANQRWLGVRLDAMGSILVFTVAMLAVGTRFKTSPAQTGVVLSYIISVQQAFTWIIRVSAEAENDMNSVERIVHYASGIEQEAPHNIPQYKPAAPWPSQGRIEMKDVVLRYRPELTPVLKGISLDIKPAEKIGIVGRTGAGKSSIMTALYRLVELSSGSILIDGVDASKVGLSDLRGGLSIIPQDASLFSGTLRSNLDPFGQHEDAKLWDALRRSYLVEPLKHEHDDTLEDDATLRAHSPMNRFTLDSIIEDEGGNLSIGQRSLVSLARALVKNAKILILDEATASVDYETDRNIQATIASEFQDHTILCIAHRLRTIISYDRICVLDAGEIAEFDSPSRLYTLPNGIFRRMCDHSSISLDDIHLASQWKDKFALSEKTMQV